MASFCPRCEQILPSGISLMMMKDKPVEFKDGIYCPICAKVKIKEARK